MASLLALGWLSCWGARAEEASPVALHRRAEKVRPSSAAPVTETKAPCTLPLDASGEYLLGSDGSEVIQISLKERQLGGYISRLGDAESDQGTPLTFFFAHSSLDGARLGFSTHPLHGVWYGFEGTIRRADVSRPEEGYYLLQGTLIKHDVVAGTSEPRRVSLKQSEQH